MPVVTCIEDLKRLHQKRTPRMFWDYCESGSYSEQTFRENISDFQKIKFRQKVARDLSERDLSGDILGQKTRLPLALSPVGSTGMQYPNGEILAARAAAKFGVPYTLSTMSICSIEEVHKHSPDPFWFQLYVMRDEDFVDQMIERARAANCSALVLTLDLQILGQRHKDLKNGLSSPPKLTLPNIINMMTKPNWTRRMMQTQNRTFGNIVGHVKGVTDLANLSSWTNEQFDLQLDWSKVIRIRDQWKGKFILKGVMDAEDAQMAVDAGADAVIVSNHGGRQLDGALSSIRALPAIRRALGDQPQIWMDGGIRSGQDVLKALAMGADAAMIGRAYIHGLGALGEAGVTAALEVIRKEMDITMALCGERDIRKFGRHNLLVPEDFEGKWA